MDLEISIRLMLIENDICLEISPFNIQLIEYCMLYIDSDVFRQNLGMAVLEKQAGVWGRKVL